MAGLLDFPLKAISAIYEKGILYWFYYWISYIFLSVLQRIQRRRTDLYDLVSDDIPEKNGFFVPKKEWEMEAPEKDSLILSKNVDAAFVFGVNSAGDALTINIARQPNEQVHCSLYLKLAGGKQYSLPSEHVLQKDSLEEYTFGSARLKLQCLLPMRKWRIFFNGILKQHLDDGTSSQSYQHVKFTLLFTASSDIFDFTSDSSKNLLSHEISCLASWKNFPLYILNRLKSIFNQYEQSGMLHGTLQIEDQEEREIYLWGSRGRYRGETRNLNNGHFNELHGTFENGAIIHLGSLDFAGVPNSLSYGYLMKSNGFIHPIETLEKSVDRDGQLHFQFDCTGENYQVKVEPSNNEGVKFEKSFDGTSEVKYAAISLNAMKGHGFVFDGCIQKSSRRKISFSLINSKFHQEVPLTLSFEYVECQDPQLAGGKGASLGKLYTLSQKAKLSLEPDSFEVPKGIVITTRAYELFTEGHLENSLQRFQKAVWVGPESTTKKLCESMVDEVLGTPLPERIIEAVMSCLLEVFKDTSSKKFAVRSSSIGEDTAQMSAAGQMETFLGLSDINEILLAIRKCWASQFSFQAVQYKRRYGQLLDVPMAVVIQEMVPCEVAGVAFTCDPVTGNPSYINITANWGLGESVVSASIDPDTVILKRDINNRIQLHSHNIGKKHGKIVMTDEGGTEEIPLSETESFNCCLDENMSLKLGRIAIKLEEKFGSPRDLEWGVLNGTLFLFQSRPVTTIDIDTDFEVKHFYDSHIRCEDEYMTKANVGEVLPGACSPLGLDIMFKYFVFSLPKQAVRFDGGVLSDAPYFDKGLPQFHNHRFLSMIGGFVQESADTDIGKSVMISIFGRIIDEPKLSEIAKERHPDHKEKSLIENLFLPWVLFMSGVTSRRLAKQFNSLPISCARNDPTEILNSACCNLYRCAKALVAHIYCTMSSSMWNTFMITLIEKSNGGWTNEVFSDFGYLLSTCKQVESADVPAAIQTLAVSISKLGNAETFKSMTTNNALNLLLNSDTNAGEQFRHFLVKHGHRCLKECDVYSTSWREDPKILVKILQDLVGSGIKETTVKKMPSFSTILSDMNVKLNLKHKLGLWLLLPNCRRGVRERENTKSLLIKTIDDLRQLFRHLAKVMVEEGFLPHENLLFFLVVDEIDQLIKTRSPRLVTRAIKRFKVHKELDKLVFPEITIGIPKPINVNEEYEAMPEDFSMTGVPVSRGIVKATARVVKNISQAFTIQQGDILIAYCTDIAWSPYFPLLSGVVTELGGLVSHGAVVAREYGLPCVVGLHGATQMFESGDTVLLDGNKGILRRLKS